MKQICEVSKVIPDIIYVPVIAPVEGLFWVHLFIPVLVFELIELLRSRHPSVCRENRAHVHTGACPIVVANARSRIGRPPGLTSFSGMASAFCCMA